MGGGIDLTPYARMPKRTNDLKKTNFTNVGFSASFICINASLCKCSHSRVVQIFVQAIVFCLFFGSIKKDCLKLMHSSMHGLGGAALLVG